MHLKTESTSHVDISNIFREKIAVFFHNKDNFAFRVALEYFCNPLTSGLTEVIWTVIYTAFNLLHYAVLVQQYEENLDSHKYVVEVKEEYFFLFR